MHLFWVSLIQIWSRGQTSCPVFQNSFARHLEPSRGRFAYNEMTWKNEMIQIWIKLYQIGCLSWLWRKHGPSHCAIPIAEKGTKKDHIPFSAGNGPPQRTPHGLRNGCGWSERDQHASSEQQQQQQLLLLLADWNDMTSRNKSTSPAPSDFATKSCFTEATTRQLLHTKAVTSNTTK